jgi:predicted negative regulator of RcsB-dependent stress response
VDRLTRHELKTDKFVADVGHAAEYVAGHRKEATRWLALGVVILVIVVAFYQIGRSRKLAREEALATALKTYNAPVGVTGNPGMLTFATQPEKDKAVLKELGGLVSKYPDTEEGSIGSYLKGTFEADKGNLDDAAKDLQTAAKGAQANYASLAKLALADVYTAQGKSADAQKVYRDLMDHPTEMVSKEQATLSMARSLAKTNVAEALKLVEPMRAQGGPTGRIAIELVAEFNRSK